jgi:hypothetical protein
MELCKEEMKRGYIWLFVAGTISLAVVLFLYNMDQTITKYHESNRVDSASTIKELREAQFSLGTTQVDQRTQVDNQ